MRLSTILLFIILACGACASRAKSARALGNNPRSLFKITWPEKNNTYLPRPESSCRSDAVAEAWKNKKSKIGSWPGAEAYQTVIGEVPAVITKNTIAVTGRKALQNELDALEATDQLLGYATLKINQFHKTYYIVRRQMGDLWGEVRTYNSHVGMVQLVKKADAIYKSKCGMDLSHCEGKDYGNYYALGKDKHNEHVAHRISFKGATPIGREYRMLTQRTYDYCIEEWQTEPNQ